MGTALRGRSRRRLLGVGVAALLSAGLIWGLFNTGFAMIVSFGPSMLVERGWSIVRWTTADDNYRARAVYDELATRTTWITYDMTPDVIGVTETSAAE